MATTVIRNSKSENIHFRVSPNEKEIIEKAVIVSGQSLTDFATRSLLNAANEILEQEYVTTLSNRDRDRLLALLDADEVAKAFTVLKEQGKVLHFGVSNFKRWQVDLLTSRFKLEVNQVECSLLHLDPFIDGTLDQCQQHKIIPMAWSPLGAGNIFLLEDDDERNKRILAVASILAQKYNSLADTILFSWLLTHPSGILPVLGTTKSDRLRNAVAATEIKLEREEWFMLWRASTGKEVA